MVVVLTGEKPLGRGKIWARFWRWWTVKPVTVEYREILGHRYLLLKVRNPAHPPWKKLRKLAGRGARQVVPAAHIPLPDGCGLAPCPVDMFHVRLTVTGACQLADIWGGDGAGMVGIYDPQGLYPWCCASLLHHYSLLCVYTQSPQRYQMEADRLLHNHGAIVLLLACPQELRRCGLIVALGSSQDFVDLPQPVLAVPGCRIRGNPTVSDLALPPWSGTETIPDGVEPWRLLAAVLQERPSSPELMQTIAGCRMDGRAAPFEEVSFVLRKQLLRSQAHAGY